MNKLYFDTGSGVLCAFVVDATGSIVLRSEAGEPDALIPYAVSMVSPAEELAHPFPWTVTEAQLVELMLALPEQVKKGQSVGSVVGKGELERFGFPFVPGASEKAHDSEIEAGLELMDTLPSDSPEIQQLKDLLERGGLVQIPRIERYIEDIHIKTSDSGSFQVVSDGWMTSMKVFRKSVIQGDQDKPAP
ncbi:hypothetical protein QAO71_17230 (plasmid) [Halopseudomonas sp. SMJS2]|uniref:hypothetical protein n=1 Tax=Halopseudomonas sp. SMJS2 TaxID=3041098 RepID=UPI0024529104|nr:hypothetical protein [Halopseudomonas sp. SMJS2]WGK63511.1 hypothetical protein QAO71_17230 [Halopseudomonas sp. SMJS2]